MKIFINSLTLLECGRKVHDLLSPENNYGYIPVTLFRMGILVAKTATYKQVF